MYSEPKLLLATVKVEKRDGRTVPFDGRKIYDAVKKAVVAVHGRAEGGKACHKICWDVAVSVTNKVAESGNTSITIEALQDMVEARLVEINEYVIAREYITYRNKRSLDRMKHSELYKLATDILETKNADLVRENSNLNGSSFSGKMSKFGSEFSKWYSLNSVLPADIAEAFFKKRIHIHDFDHYAVGTHNCTFVRMGELLKNGFSTGNGSVRPANSIQVAMAQVAIVFQSQQNSQFGGVGANMIDYDLAPFIDCSYRKHLRKGIKYFYGKEYTKQMLIGAYIDDKDSIWMTDYPKAHEYAVNETIEESKQAAQALIHNLNTMSSRSGGQIPFTSLNYGTCTTMQGRIVISAILDATIDGLGNGETPIFPIQIFKCKKGVNRAPGDPNFDLYMKAIECTSKRLYPNYTNLDAPFNLQYYKEGDPDTEMATMG